METLDQLCGGDLPLTVVRGLYPDRDHFVRGISALLAAGHVSLILPDGEAQRWQWKDLLLSCSGSTRVRLTQQGATKIT